MCVYAGTNKGVMVKARRYLARVDSLLTMGVLGIELGHWV